MLPSSRLLRKRKRQNHGLREVHVFPVRAVEKILRGKGALLGDLRDLHVPRFTHAHMDSWLKYNVPLLLSLKPFLSYCIGFEMDGLKLFDGA